MSTTPSNIFGQSPLYPLFPDEGKFMGIQLAANLTLTKGTVLGQITSAAATEVQSLVITGTPTGGTFKLVFGQYVTVPIAYNATAAVVQAALQALPNIGAGGVVCTGGPLPGSAVTLTFAAGLAGQPQNLITVTGAAFTGGAAPAAAVTRTTAGVAGYTGTPGVAGFVPGRYSPYATGNADGTQAARMVLAYDVATDPQGRITLGALPNGGEKGELLPTVAAYFKGTFKVSDLTGLDAGALTGFARLLIGTVVDGAITLF